MLQYEELRLKLEGLLPQIEDLAGSIGLTQLKREADELDARAAAPGFWDDMEHAKKITQKAASVKGKIENYEKLLHDTEVWQSLWNTIKYAIIGISIKASRLVRIYKYTPKYAF